MEPAILPLTNRIARHGLSGAVRRLGARGRGRDHNLPFLRPLRRLRRAPSRLLVAGRPSGRSVSLGSERSASRGQRDRRLSESSDLVVSVSEAVVDELESRGVDAAYLPNGCEAAFYEGVDRVVSCARSELAWTDRGVRRAPEQPHRPRLARGNRHRRRVSSPDRPSDPAFEPDRFESLAARPNVSYLGPKPFEDAAPLSKSDRRRHRPLREYAASTVIATR